MSLRPNHTPQEADAISELVALIEEIGACNDTTDLFQSVNDVVPLYYAAIDAKGPFDEFMAGVRRPHHIGLVWMHECKRASILL